jgi:hypothetical protein
MFTYQLQSVGLVDGRLSFRPERLDEIEMILTVVYNT